MHIINLVFFYFDLIKTQVSHTNPTTNSDTISPKMMNIIVNENCQVQTTCPRGQAYTTSAFHAFLFAPVLIYLAYMGWYNRPFSKNWFLLLGAMGIGAAFVHLWRIKKINDADRAAGYPTCPAGGTWVY